MKKIANLILILAFIYAFPQFTLGSESNNHEHQDDHDQKHENDEGHDDDDHGHDEKTEEGVTFIDDDMAKQVDIKTDKAGPRSLHQTISSFGRLATGPEQMGRVRARFPGVIKSIKVTIGDQVKAGDIVALIESNESLRNYKVRAPISGTVIQQAANVGESVQDQVLFTISNYDLLLAELRIFPSQQKNLVIGQLVHILFEDKRYDATISHLLPAESNSPYIIALTKLHGPHNNLLPGLMIEGRIVVGEFKSPLTVANSGLQTIGNQIGVFIKEEDKYTFTPLVLGRTDDEFTEVLSGMDSGAEYVSLNSYLIKADIEKSEAEHEH